MAFSFGTPAGASTPAFGFGAASTPAFGTANTPFSTATSAPLFGSSAATSAGGFFGASNSTSGFSMPSSQPTQTPSLFGSAPTFPAASSSAVASFPSVFGAVSSTTTPTPSMFGQAQQLGTFGGTPAMGATAAVPLDDSAVKELQSIKDAYVAGPGNHRHRFQYVFLNVVDNPAARVKPADVDELQWREALRRAGGPDNPDRLWPVLAVGFKELIARKAAQDEAIKEHTTRLEALQQNVAVVAARQEAVLRAQYENVKRRHLTLCRHLLRVLRRIDALEGRFAHAIGYRSATPRDILQKLTAELTEIEAATTQGAGMVSGLTGRVEALTAAARLQAGAGPAGGKSLGDLEAVVDSGSLASAFTMLSESGEALERMQAVLRRGQRDMAVLQDISGRKL